MNSKAGLVGGREGIRESAYKTGRSVLQTLPWIVGLLMLVSLLVAAIPDEAYAAVFTGNPLIDSCTGAFFGSIAAGNPVTSYVIGGELLEAGISLAAVTAFLITWVTVGIVSLPAEMQILGRRFALVRNLSGFLFSIAIAVCVVLTLSVVGGGT
ncbi:hypothetical protein [Methanofollis fontis]|uniref:Permease n=1 Tax=Methanofollis fontis TaxID=2052832 RepID=A0A483CRS6_9EURY|nr:hypothetical protein [Methanofollis fontis]TAJ45845.1 hypothetical protein CUJ86_01220 [Methanofollis fontis]